MKLLHNKIIMNILTPEAWKKPNQTLKDKLKAFKQQFIENFSLPKETDKEYKTLQEILWDNFEKYKKHWTITSINRAQTLKGIGMEIKPTDRIHMRHRTTKRIKKLEKWKEDHGDTLSYTYNKWQWRVTKDLKPTNWDIVKI